MSKKCILVVEDDALSRLAVTEVLQDEGYEVFAAADGIEALSMFSVCQPDLVLTDLDMPHLDGMGVLAHVQRVAPHTPVMIFTADMTQDAEEKARSLGVRDYLNKPLDLPDLLRRIAQIFTHTVRLGKPSGSH